MRRHYHVAPKGALVGSNHRPHVVTFSLPDIPNPACSGPGRNPDDWFNNDKGAEHIRAEARAICNTCPGQVECLAYALREDIRFGIWGGLDLDQRIALTWKARQ